MRAQCTRAHTRAQATRMRTCCVRGLRPLSGWMRLSSSASSQPLITASVERSCSSHTTCAAVCTRTRAHTPHREQANTVWAAPCKLRAAGTCAACCSPGRMHSRAVAGGRAWAEASVGAAWGVVRASLSRWRRPDDGELGKSGQRTIVWPPPPAKGCAHNPPPHAAPTRASSTHAAPAQARCVPTRAPTFCAHSASVMAYMTAPWCSWEPGTAGASPTAATMGCRACGARGRGQL